MQNLTLECHKPEQVLYTDRLVENKLKGWDYCRHTKTAANVLSYNFKFPLFPR